MGAMPAAPIAAQPVSDVRDVKVKVRDLKLDRKTFEGTASSRPSATDDDKYIVTCTGGGLDGLTCVYTSTTSECWVERKDARPPGAVPQADDGLGVAKARGAQADAAHIAHDDRSGQDTHCNHGKHGKHRRR
jgi:hypothetical protein